MNTIQPYTRFIALVLAAFVLAGCANKMAPAQKAVSYTHLTLPTNREV